MTPADVIGWSSSAILLATLIHQIVKDQKDATSGASGWLFAGQTLASIGFITYSALVGNWVFIVTNALILATSVAGFVLHARSKRQNR